MVKVENDFGKSFYMDNHLARELDVVRKSVLTDDDRVFIVDGGERKGKSVLAMQLCAKVDPSFSLDRVCFTPDDFVKAIKSAKQYQAVLFDEAFTGLSSRNSLSRVNNLLVSLMMEMGQKNLFVFIVMPSIFFLERYVVLFRANGLFHVYTSGSKRGRWAFFKRDRLKYLYLNGKKFFSYKSPQANFRGLFLNKYVIDEKLYRSRKKEALESKSLDNSVSSRSDIDRNRLLWCLSVELGISFRELEEVISRYDVKLNFSSISRAVSVAKRYRLE